MVSGKGCNNSVEHSRHDYLWGSPSKSDLHRGLSLWDLAPSCSLWHFFVYLWNHKSNVKSEICRQDQESKEKSFQDRAENKNSNFGCWSHFIPFIFWKRQTFTKIIWKNSPHIKTENSPLAHLVLLIETGGTDYTPQIITNIYSVPGRLGWCIKMSEG